MPNLTKHKIGNGRRGAVIAGLALAVLPILAAAAGLNWPARRLLPAFSEPAPVLDCIDTSSTGGEEADLFASLEGIVNRTQPRIACVNRREGDIGYTWLRLHHVRYQTTDGFDAILKYRTKITGLVVPDSVQRDTLNLATTIAGVKNELICDADLLPMLTNAPYNLPIVDDLRHRFADKYAVYGYLLSNYWPRCTHRVIAGMSPNIHGCLRDYLVAVKSATLWLGPGKKRDAALLAAFVSGMTREHGVYMGWWPGEGDGLKWISRYGIPVLASDFYGNATVFSGVASAIHVPAIPPPPRLENRVYVALMLSDGDNIQYMQHTMMRNWDNPARGSIPIGWTASPLAVDMDPAMLNYYWTTATTNDCLVSGPSGAGYAHINDWSDADIAAFAKVSAPYFKRSGLRVITVWDTVTSPVDLAFATHCRTLLGLTDQGGTAGRLKAKLPIMKLTPAYTSSITNMIDGITNAAAAWDGTDPVFVAAQSDVWHLGPADLVKVARSLDTNKYTLVRPDQLFLLARKAQSQNKLNQ